MNRILYHVGLLAVVAGVAAGCSDDHDLVIAPESEFEAPVLAAVPFQQLVFNEQTDLNAAIGTITWQKASYGYSAPVNYVLQVDTAGGDFSAPVEVGTSIGTHLEITGKVLNNAGKNFTTLSEVVKLDFRLKTVIGSIDFDAPVQHPLYSNVESVTFTPYISEIPLKEAYYLVGDALVGWNNVTSAIGADLQPFFSANNDLKDKVYSFTGYFKDGGAGFKLVTTPGVWDDAYGFSASGSSGNLGAGNTGDNYQPAKAGYYTFTADFGANTYKMVAFDASKAEAFQTIGIIGDATPGGWTLDTPMQKVAGQDHLWVLAKVTLSAGGGLKFRANGSWDGGGNWGTGTIPFGKAENSGGSGNIMIENGGDYFIEFNDLTAEYVIMPLKNAQKK